MNYYQSRNKYLKKKLENPLPPLQENERIYFNATYYDRDFLRCCHCGFDKSKKLWFTGCLNSHIDTLVRLYGVHDCTSDKALELMNNEFKKRAGTLLR